MHFVQGREHTWTDLGWKKWVYSAAVPSGAVGMAGLGVGYNH